MAPIVPFLARLRRHVRVISPAVRGPYIQAAMKLLHRRYSRLFVSGLCVFWLALAVQQAAQSPMSVTPANPTIFAGQTQQFSASGATTASAVSAGGDYTCVRLPDGTAQCTGRNQFGQLGDGSWTDSSTLVPVSGITTATRVAAGHEFACALLVERHGEVLGTRRVRTAWRRHLRHLRVGARRGERPQRRRRPRGRIWTRLRAALERDDAVLGREHRRAARQRHDRQPRHRAAGHRQRHHRRHRLHHRRVSHLRAARERHAAVLGTERQRAARQRDPYEFVHARGGDRHHHVPPPSAAGALTRARC